MAKTEMKVKDKHSERIAEGENLSEGRDPVTTASGPAHAGDDLVEMQHTILIRIQAHEVRLQCLHTTKPHASFLNCKYK